MQKKLISKITTNVGYTVSLGNGVFATSLLVEASGTVDPTAAGSAGIFAAASVADAKVGNLGTIRGAVGAAYGAGGDAVELAGASSSVNNRGLIAGGAGGAGGVTQAAGLGGVGVFLQGSDGTITNRGTILGGNAGATSAASVAAGINYSASGGAAAVLGDGGKLTNAGTILGGTGSIDNYGGGAAGAGGAGTYLTSGGTITNGGHITGGTGGAGYVSAAYPPPSGFGGQGGNAITTAGPLTLTNAAAGVLLGGTGGNGGGGYGGSGGDGIFATSSALLTNHGTILGGASGYGGTGGDAIYFGGGGTLTNTGVIRGGASYGPDASDNPGGYGVRTATFGSSAILTNSGTILGGNGASAVSYASRGGGGVYLAGGASLTNAGTIRGGTGGNSEGTGYGSRESGTGGGGVYVTRGTLTNTGLIAGGLGGVGINGGSGGLGVLIGSNSIVANRGTITGGAGGASNGYNGFNGGAGVDVFEGGTLTTSGTVLGGTGDANAFRYGDAGYGGAGVNIYGGIVLTTGHIQGGEGGQSIYGGRGGAGVFLSDGGTLVSSGTILGGSGGASTNDSPGTGGFGVDLTGGTIANYGTITGGNGGTSLVVARGGNGGAGVYLQSGTLITGGTISGGAGGKGGGGQGFGGDAVRLDGPNCTLELLPGAIFNGDVAGNASYNDTLILGGTTSGTLNGLGVQITGFTQIIESAGATWTVNDAANFGSYSGITAYGVLVLNGMLSGEGTVSATAGSTVDLAGGGDFSGLLVGAGTLAITAATTLSAGAAIDAAYIVNTSQITLASGVDLTNQGGNVFSINTTPAASAGPGHRSNPDLTGAAGDLFTNAGAFNVGGSTEAYIGVKFDNAGTLALTGGTLAFTSALYGTGNIGAAANTTLDIGAAGSSIGGTLSSAGTVMIGGATKLLAGGGLSASSIVDMSVLTLGVGVNLTNAAGDNLTLTTVAAPSYYYGSYGGRGHRSNPDITGPAGSSLVNEGSLYSSSAGVNTISVDLTNGGLISVSSGTLAVKDTATIGGTIAAAATTLVDFAAGGSFYGAITGAGSVEFDGATTLNSGISLATANLIDTAVITLGVGVDLTNASGNTLTLTNTVAAAAGYYPPTHRSNPDITGPGGSDFFNVGTLVAAGPGTSDVSVDCINSGTVLCNAGTLAFLGALTNNGLIDASGGLTSAAFGVTGTGTLQIDAAGTLSLLGGAASTQQLDFTASTGLLELASPLTFDASIAGFAASDQIDLLRVASTSFTFSGGVLTVKDHNTVVASLNFTGNYVTADFATASDGHGGTTISYV
jgi:fibronectin-binding autotransporter adhesin